MTESNYLRTLAEMQQTLSGASRLALEQALSPMVLSMVEAARQVAEPFQAANAALQESAKTFSQFQTILNSSELITLGLQANQAISLKLDRVMESASFQELHASLSQTFSPSALNSLTVNSKAVQELADVQARFRDLPTDTWLEQLKVWGQNEDNVALWAKVLKDLPDAFAEGFKEQSSTGAGSGSWSEEIFSIEGLTGFDMESAGDGGAAFKREMRLGGDVVLRTVLLIIAIAISPRETTEEQLRLLYTFLVLFVPLSWDVAKEQYLTERGDR